MLTENLSSYAFFAGAAEKQVEGEWEKGEEGQKQKEMKGKRPRSSSCVLFFLLFSPQRPYDSCLLLSTVGLGWSCQVLGIPGVHREKLGAVWLEVVPPVP